MIFADDASFECKIILLAHESASMMRALRAGRSLGLRSWCIGAGAVRNLVWDHLHEFTDETEPEDIDLVFYDASNLSQDLEESLERRLAAEDPSVKWDVVNQASVHQWLSKDACTEPFLSLAEGVASWPEVATCVGLTLSKSGEVEVIAPYGLTDLFSLVVRRNPTLASKEVYIERIRKKRFSERWPKVRIFTDQHLA